MDTYSSRVHDERNLLPSHVTSEQSLQLYDDVDVLLQVSLQLDVVARCLLSVVVSIRFALTLCPTKVNC